MSQSLKYILGFLGLVIFCWAVWYFRNIVAYVLVSAVLSILGAPIVRLLRKIKIGKWNLPSSIAALITLLLFMGVVAAFFSVFAPLVASEAQTISNIDVEKTAQNLEQPLAKTEAWLNQFNLSGDETGNREYLISQLKKLVDFGQISTVFNNIFAILGSAFAAIFSIVFITFFFLKDSNMVARIVYTMTPDKHMSKTKEIMSNTSKMLTRYFGGLVAQISIIAVLLSIGLSILGVENAFLIAFLASIFNVIPYVGPIIGGVLALTLTLTTNLDLDFNSEMLPLLGKIAIVFAIVQLLDNLLIQPIIFSNSVKAHPLEIFLVISIAGTLAGVTGMVLAIPAYTLIRIIAKEFLSGFKVVDSLTRNI
jgi:predicted PurR-regulated permease PerM